MKVREVIAKLMEDYTLDEELVIAWWDKYLIEKYLTDDPMFPVNISDKDRAVICHNMAELPDRANADVVDAIEDQYGSITHDRYYSR